MRKLLASVTVAGVIGFGGLTIAQGNSCDPTKHCGQMTPPHIVVTFPPSPAGVQPVQTAAPVGHYTAPIAVPRTGGAL